MGELRHMLRDDDVNHEEQKQILELGMKFRADRFYRRPFEGPQGVAVIFDKPSTRTRSSFSIGVAELGGYPLVIDKSGSQLGRGEPVADTAEVLTRMAYGIVWRTFEQSRVEQMARVATVPVVNALTDEFHPCQAFRGFPHAGAVQGRRGQSGESEDCLCGRCREQHVEFVPACGRGRRHGCACRRAERLPAGPEDRRGCPGHRRDHGWQHHGDRGSRAGGRRCGLHLHRYLSRWARKPNTRFARSRSGHIR